MRAFACKLEDSHSSKDFCVIDFDWKMDSFNKAPHSDISDNASSVLVWEAIVRERPNGVPIPLQEHQCLNGGNQHHRQWHRSHGCVCAPAVFATACAFISFAQTCASTQCNNSMCTQTAGDATPERLCLGVDPSHTAYGGETQAVVARPCEAGMRHSWKDLCVGDGQY